MTRQSILCCVGIALLTLANSGCTDAGSKLKTTPVVHVSSGAPALDHEKTEAIPSSTPTPAPAVAAPVATVAPLTTAVAGPGTEAELHAEAPFVGPERGDGWLTLRIRSLLLVRSDLSGTKAHVRVRDGVVRLTGVAESEMQRSLTEKIARSVEGVRAVRNEMTVADSADARSPLVAVPIDPES